MPQKMGGRSLGFGVAFFALEIAIVLRAGVGVGALTAVLKLGTRIFRKCDWRGEVRYLSLGRELEIVWASGLRGFQSAGWKAMRQKTSRLEPVKKLAIADDA
jgi:hypothetical protein